MSETPTPTATRPARVRKPVATKTATPKVAAPKAVVPAESTEVATPAESEAFGKRERFGFQMDSTGDTKTYSKWSPPQGSGCVGTLYVPLGTAEVKVLVLGPEV